MKKILFLLLICQSAFCQQKEWENLKIDSVEFMEKYGSVYEYDVQHQVMKKSRNGYKVLFIGAKAGYINYLILYLDQKHWEFTSSENNNIIKINAKTYNNELAYNARLNFQFVLDKQSRIKSATVTGTANDVIELFLDYWEDYNINVNNLKQKKAIYIMQATDKVSYSWTGINPLIAISKGNISFEFDKKQNSSN